MSTFRSTTFGMISGRHGNAVAAEMRNGVNVLKVFNAPFNPKSVKQVAQRSKFKFAIQSLACLRDLFKTTFRAQGGANYGISLAFKNCVAGISPDYSIDYTKMILSQGSINGSTNNSAEKSTGTSVMVTWVSSVKQSALASDNVNLVFFHNEFQEVVLKENCAKRTAGTLTVELPNEWAEGSVHCWIYFSRNDGSRNSTSNYIIQVQL